MGWEGPLCTPLINFMVIFRYLYTAPRAGSGVQRICLSRAKLVVKSDKIVLRNLPGARRSAQKATGMCGMGKPQQTKILSRPMLNQFVAKEYYRILFQYKPIFVSH